MGELQHANSKLAATVAVVEDFVEKIEFLEEVKAREKEWDALWQQIHDVYSLVDEYKIPVPAMDRAAYQTMDGAYSSVKGLADEVEGARDDNITRFSCDLENGKSSALPGSSPLRLVVCASLELEKQ
jgi:dynein heavy chain, axonemal